MAKATWSLKEGDEIVAGRSAIKRLGGGRRYEAYLAWDEKLHSQVVVKMLRPDQNEDPKAIADLEREADTLARLSHPMLVRAFDARTSGPRPHLVLEHFEGPTLRRLVRGFGPLPLEQLVPLAVQVAGVIHYMHAEETVHLDVKPGNIIMEAPPKLIDLSIARRFAVAQKLKKPVGTRAYMPPEQCDPVNLGPPGPAADVWGLGATLFHAVTGDKPFHEDDESDSEPGNRSYPQLSEQHRPWPKDVPEPVRDMLERCLTREPTGRPSPAQVAEGLGPLLAGLPDRPRLRRSKPRYFG